MARTGTRAGAKTHYRSGLDRWRGAVSVKAFVLVLTSVLIVSGPAVAQQRLAIADFDFLDTSGEPRPQEEEHASRLTHFLEALRGEIGASGSFEVVQPDCPEDCSAARTPFDEMSAAVDRADAELLLVGRVRKISTLIGTINITMLDLKGDRVICERSLNYRGDNDEAWSRAAVFAAEDVVRYCHP